MTGSLRFQDTGQHRGLLLGPQDQPLARYSWGTTANHPYFDDVRPAAHLGVLTTHAPHDHRWHHGLWWSWKFLNDVLFWEDHPGYGGNRTGLGRSVVEAHEVVPVGDGVRFDERLSWRVDGSGEVLLTEERSVTASLEPAPAGGWALDWDQTWTASTDVRLSTTPWPETSWGGYAGLNYRAARAMAAGESIVGAGGRTGRAAVHGEHLAWAAYTGQVDGAERDEPQQPARGGVALLEHPGNPGHPNPFYAFSAADDFGFLATAPLMRQDRVLPAGERLALRTRVLVLPAPLAPEELASAHAAYAAPAAAHLP